MAEKLPKIPEYNPPAVSSPIPQGPLPNKNIELAIVAVIISVIVIIGAIAVALFIRAPQSPPATGPILTLSVNSASWEYLESHGYRTYNGDLYLWVSVTLTNTGTENLTVFPWDFKLQDLSGNLYNSTSIFSGGNVAWGGHLDTTLIFEIPPSCTPSKIVFDSYFLTAISDSVPTPAALQPDVVIGSIEARWHLTDPDGLVIPPNQQFLWLTFNMTNLWSKSIDLGLLNFNVTGSGSEHQLLWEISGPETLAAGSTDGVRLIFWVDVGFVPNILNYQDFFGPYTSASIPIPTWA
jgi:hypothetical protein